MAFGLSWEDISLRYVEFLGYFGIYGALGFRILLSRLKATHSGAHYATEIAKITEVSERRAATIGCFGSLLLIAELVMSAGQAAAKHPSLLHAILHPGPKILTELVFGFIALFAFLGALNSIRSAWGLAAIAGVGFVFRNIASRRATAVVNPLHEAGAALWLGTLLVLVIVGLPAVMYATGEHRRRVMAELVANFSPIALSAAGLMALTGVITSWTHLKHIAALWTTAYGRTLDLKLGMVAIVAALGAWNWRRIGPALKTEDAVGVLRRTSTTELAFGAIVLLFTAVLVLLPSPK
ncbi:MAG: CopD family protein [Acidobacteriaceae bacterium]|nr:CopD family protein [Acidobacteriaceae bacterium]